MSLLTSSLTAGLRVAFYWQGHLLQLRSNFGRSPNGLGRKKEIPGQLAKPAKAEGTLALTTGQAPRIQRPGVGGLGIWEKRRL